MAGAESLILGPVDSRNASVTQRLRTRSRQTMKNRLRRSYINGRESYFLAFRGTEYLWLWLGNIVSGAGFTVDMLAQGWIVLEITGEPFWVGFAAGVRGITWFLFGPPTGALMDRLDRRKILAGVYLLGCGGAAVISTVVFMGAVELWHMLLFSALMGLVMAVNQPANTSLTYDLVGPQRVLNANAFRFMGSGVIRIGAAIGGGYLIDTVGVGGNYTMAAAAYLASTGFVLMLSRPKSQSSRREPFLNAITTGLKYAFTTPAVRRLLLISLTVEFFGFSYLWMLPVMARDVLEVGGVGLGYLTAAAGAGSLAAMIVLASRGDVGNKQLLLAVGAVGFGLSVAMFGISPWFPLSLALVFLIGCMSSTYDSSLLTSMQLSASHEMRGRILGLYVSTWGVNQLGGIGLGAVATFAGAPLALFISGLAASALVVRHIPRFLKSSEESGDSH